MSLALVSSSSSRYFGPRRSSAWLVMDLASWKALVAYSPECRHHVGWTPPYLGLHRQAGDAPWTRPHWPPHAWNLSHGPSAIVKGAEADVWVAGWVAGWMGGWASLRKWQSRYQ